MAALTLALAATLLLAVAWPMPNRARHHRISNYFFMRRYRREQLRNRTPGGSEAGDALSPSARHLMEVPGLSAVVPPARPGPPPNPGGRDSVVPPDSRGHRAPQTPAGAAFPHSLAAPAGPNPQP